LASHAFSLRPATADDQARIRELIQEGNINPFGLDWERFTVAESSEGAVIGCGQIKPHRDGSQELASLAVTAAWRGQGVARAIIEHYIQGHEGDLYLMCASGVGPLYEKFGFEVIEEPDQMPRYFSRMSKIVEAVPRLLKRGRTLLIMKLVR